MNSKNRKTLLCLTSALAGLTAFAAVGVAMQAQKVSADTAPVFEMVYGAGLRVSDPTGIRFKTKFDKTYYDKITTTEAELHVLILPYSYYDAYQATDKSLSLYEWTAQEYGTVLDLTIPDSKIYQQVEDGVTYYMANAVMSNVRLNNYHVDFVGAAYITDGTTYEDVSGIIEEDNARSVFEIACKANVNATDEQKETYGDFLLATLDKGLYSAYGVKYNPNTLKYIYNGVEYAEEELSASVVNLADSKFTVADESLYVGKEKQLNATLTYADGTKFTKETHCTWQSSDESIATVDENGVVTALKAGTAEITATGIGGLYTAETTVTVTEKPVNEEFKDVVAFMAQGDAGKWDYNTGNATVDLSGIDFDLSEVTQILCNGSEVDFTYSGDSLTLINAPGGDQIYTFVTEDMDYVIGGCIYGLGISTVEELEAWRTSESYWYAVLLNDIDYEGATVEVSAKNVLGTIDGRGYKIQNFTYTKGFFKASYGSAAVIKNIYFAGLTQDCTGMGKYPNYGLFSQWMNGTMENVYVDVTTTNLDEGAEHTSTLCFGFEATAVVKNVVLDIKNANGNFHYGVDTCRDGATVVGFVGGYEGAKGSTQGGGAAWGAAGGFHAKLSWMVAEEANDELLTFTSPYWVIDTTARTITMQPKNKVGLKKTVVNINDTVLLAQGNGGKWSYDTGNATADFSAYGADFSNIVSVKLDGVELSASAYTASGSTITLINAAGGDHAITVETGTHIYNATVCVYVIGISTVDELNSWRTTECYQYAVLLNDIDYEGATLAVGGNMYNTLDGRGYQIKNFTYTKGFVNWLYGAQSAIKNVYFKNITQDCTGMGKYPNCGLFGTKSANGTIENVYVDVTTTNMDVDDSTTTDENEAAEHIATLCLGLTSTGAIKNVVLDIKNENGNFHYGINQNAEGSTVEGFVGSYAGAKGSSQGGTAAWGTASGFHQRLDWMVAEEANDELLTFTSPYWVIDTTARTITMQPYQYNYSAVEGATSGTVANGTVSVDLSATGIDVSAIKSVTVDGAAVEVEVDGSVLTYAGAAGYQSLVIAMDDGATVYQVAAKVKAEETAEEVVLDKIKLNDTYYNEKGSLDLTGSGIDVSAITSVTSGGAAVEYTADGSVLTVAAQTNGTEYAYVITTATAEYTLKVLACDVAISTAEEFTSWVTTATGDNLTTDYAVLANNITLDGSVVSGVRLYGTFDGQGYAISNLTTTGTAGLFSAFAGTFKNVQLINYTQDCNNAAAKQGLFGDWTSGTVENLLIQGQIINLGANTHNGVLLHYVTGGTYKNIVAYLESDGTGTHYGISMGGTGGAPTADNIYFVSSTEFNMSFNYEYEGNTVTDTVNYATEADMLAAIDFSTWSSPWSVDKNGAPCMREFKLPQISLNDTVALLADGKITLDLDSLGVSGAVTKVTVGGANAAYTVDGSACTLETDEGDRELCIYTKWVQYSLTVTACDEASAETLETTFLAQAVDGSATVDLSGAGVDLSALKKVFCSETAVAFSVEGSSLTLTGAPYGDQTYLLVMEGNQYLLEGCVYQNGITTVDQLNTWRNAGTAGYSVLLNDIDYEGATITEGAFVTDATLDGRGYTVSNFMYKNFVTRLYNNNAVVKNVYFDNVTQDCSSWTGAIDQGLFGNWHSGVIENVYANITTTGMNGEHYGALFYGTEANAVVRNVVVEIESECVKDNGNPQAHYVHMKNEGTGAVVENLIGSGLNVAEGGKAGYSTAASGFHQQLSWMVAEEINDELLTFTSPYWVIDAAARTITMLPLAESKPSVVEDGYLVKEGKSAYTIVISSEASSAEKEAATELQALFEEGTGVALRTVTDSNVTYSDGAKYISIGNTDLLSEAGISMDTTALGAQGFALRTNGQNIFIIGQPQGTVYGVYELLARTLGFEQYTKTVYTLDSVLELALPELQVEDMPDIEHRVAFSGVQLNDETSRHRMRTQSGEEIIMNKGGQHNMTRYIVPFDTYYSTNPTWFSSKTDSSDTYGTTQLCYTAGGYGSDNYNAMKAVAVANIKQIILDNPNADLMSLTQMDVQDMWCNCSGCQAVISQYGEESATQILFINDVVTEIKTWLTNEQGGREVKFMMFAYYETQEAPTQGNLVLHEDVSVWIAPIKDNFTTDVNASGNSLGTMLSDWKDNASSVSIWAYGVYFSEYLVPYNNFDYIDQLIDACVASKAEYMWVQGNWNTTANTGFDSLKAYLISKLMWDSTLDVNTLTDKYFNAVYGAAASTMKTVYTEMKTELTSMSLSGNIYDAPCGFNDWDDTYLEAQLGRLETAIGEIASLKTSDPTQYQIIYDEIMRESISLRYIYIENSKIDLGITTIGGAEYSSKVWSTTFKDDVTRLGFTMVREADTMESYLG